MDQNKQVRFVSRKNMKLNLLGYWANYFESWSLLDISEPIHKNILHVGERVFDMDVYGLSFLLF